MHIYAYNFVFKQNFKAIDVNLDKIFTLLKIYYCILSQPFSLLLQINSKYKSLLLIRNKYISSSRCFRALKDCILSHKL